MHCAFLGYEGCLWKLIVGEFAIQVDAGSCVRHFERKSFSYAKSGGDCFVAMLISDLQSWTALSSSLSLSLPSGGSTSVVWGRFRHTVGFREEMR